LAFEVAFALAVVFLPPMRAVFDTAAPPAWAWALLLPMPVLVWSLDEVYRARRRRREAVR
jgi:hypothetical protein